MACPFQDTTETSICLVLLIAGDALPECTKGRFDDDTGRGYRCCSHYGLAIRGGLASVLQIARKMRRGSAAPGTVGKTNPDASGASAKGGRS